MAFEKKVPDWHAAGAEPPASLKNSGFTPGYKPPADYFNWFWYCVSQCLAELQAMSPEDIGASASSHGHGNATTTEAGFMSGTDKTKLDGIAENANNYSHPTTSGNKHIPSGGSEGQFLEWSSNGTAKWSTLDYLPLSGGALTGPLTAIDNFNVNKTYDSTEYKTYVRPINYSVGNNGDYSAGLILYKGETNQAQLMFNKDGVMLRDNVAGKAYSLFGQHNASVAATSIRSNLYTYGTTNMTANSSALAEGKMYLQYE